jgi:acetyl-CoA carboxylase beta subunit
MSAVFDVTLEHHLAARARLELLFDPGTFRPIRSAVGDGVLSGSGRVQGRPVVAWAQDGSFKGGSLGSAGGETIARTIERADALGVPVVGFPHSGGARLQEGVASR